MVWVRRNFKDQLIPHLPLDQVAQRPLQPLKLFQFASYPISEQQWKEPDSIFSYSQVFVRMDERVPLKTFLLQPKCSQLSVFLHRRYAPFCYFSGLSLSSLQ